MSLFWHLRKIKLSCMAPLSGSACRSAVYNLQGAGNEPVAVIRTWVTAYKVQIEREMGFFTASFVIHDVFGSAAFTKDGLISIHEDDLPLSNTTAVDVHNSISIFVM